MKKGFSVLNIVCDNYLLKASKMLLATAFYVHATKKFGIIEKLESSSKKL